MRAVESELWNQVKVGDWLIYADRYEGPYKVLIVEIDIKMYEEGPPARWEYPYGLTAETGTVKIKRDDTETYENLANLIKFSNAYWIALLKAWEKYRAKKVLSDEYLETFLGLVTEFKG